MQKIKYKLNTVNTQKVYPPILAPAWNELSLKLNIKTAPTTIIKIQGFPGQKPRIICNCL